MANREGLVGLVAVSDKKAALRIAEAVVDERLAACVQVLPAMRSVYRWEGKVRTDDEVLCLFKTTKKAWPALQKRIVAMHGYEIPEVIALEVADGHAPYLDWISESVSPAPRKSRG